MLTQTFKEMYQYRLALVGFCEIHWSVIANFGQMLTVCCYTLENQKKLDHIGVSVIISKETKNPYWDGTQIHLNSSKLKKCITKKSANKKSVQEQTVTDKNNTLLTIPKQ